MKKKLFFSFFFLLFFLTFWASCKVTLHRLKSVASSFACNCYPAKCGADPFDGSPHPPTKVGVFRLDAVEVMAQAPLWGDLDNDGKVNITDLIELVRKYLEPGTDLNSDGKLNGIDFAKLHLCLNEGVCGSPTSHIGFVGFPSDVGGGEDPAQTLGISWMRDSAFWYIVEPQQGVFDWNKLDGKIQSYQNRGPNVVLTISSKSEWGTKLECDRTYPNVSCPPKEMSWFNNFIAKLVERYDGDGIEDMPGLTKPVKYWQIENEWDSPAYWGGTNEELLELIQNAYQTIKTADPESKVILGGITSGMLRAILVCEGIMEDGTENCNDPRYPLYKQKVEYILANAQNYFDIVDFHQYTDYLEIPFKVAWLKERLPGKVIWNTEAGGPDLSYEEYSDAEHTKQIVKRYVLAFGNNVDKVFWFSIKDLPSTLPFERPWHYQGLFREDNSKKPGYYTYKLLSSKIEGFSLVEKVSSTSGAEIYKFMVGGKPVYVLWNEEGEKTIEFSVDSSRALMTKIIIQAGQTEPETEIKEAVSGKVSLQLTPTPIFVEEI